MKELLPVVSDDLTWAEEKVREPATHEASFGYMGVWYNLDLNDPHHVELSRLAQRYIRAGTRTSKPVSAQRAAPDFTDFQNMRAWADKTQFRTRNGKPGYHQSNDGGGGYYHTRDLKRAWAAHKEESGGLGSDRDG